MFPLTNGLSVPCHGHSIGAGALPARTRSRCFSMFRAAVPCGLLLPGSVDLAYGQQSWTSCRLRVSEPTALFDSQSDSTPLLLNQDKKGEGDDSQATFY